MMAISVEEEVVDEALLDSSPNEAQTVVRIGFRRGLLCNTTSATPTKPPTIISVILSPTREVERYINRLIVSGSLFR